MTEKEFEDDFKTFIHEMANKITIMEFDNFKNEIFEQNRMIASRLVAISGILDDLRAEVEAIDAALIKE